MWRAGAWENNQTIVWCPGNIKTGLTNKIENHKKKTSKIKEIVEDCRGTREWREEPKLTLEGERADTAVRKTEVAGMLF